ncbi:hypothetical protein EI94DRAFT_1810040 [Lactarius quietus]|nr:hypothetical protein EI94DRAFT_1810040 [Lactarius quietus]
MVLSDAVFYDPVTFRKHFKNIGRAYREQATTLIEICRMFQDSPQTQTYSQYDRLQNILRLADAVVTAAGKARKRRTPEATDAFLRVQEEIIPFVSLLPRMDRSGDHRKTLFNPRTALEAAVKKDEERASTLSTVKSIFPDPDLTKGPTKRVNFVVLESPHERREELRIVNQEINNSTTTAEIIWRFSRYPEESGRRITPSQNPHFYLELSENAASYGSEFQKDSLKGFGHSLETGGTIYILLDKSCRLFIEATEPRIFSNVWKPRRTVILKDVRGVLESEDIVLRDIGERQDYWHRPSRVADSFQHRIAWDYSDDDREIINTQFANAGAVIHAAVRAQGVDLMIRDRSMPEPSADSGWKPLPSPEPSGAMVQGIGEHATPTTQSTRQSPQPENSSLNSGAYSIGSSTLFSTSTDSFETVVNTSEVYLPMRGAAGEDRTILSATRLPRVQYSNPNSSVLSIGVSTLFTTSTESFETATDTPEVFIPMRRAVGNRTQLTDYGIGLQQLELSTADTVDDQSQSSSSAPPTDIAHILRLRYMNSNPDVPSISGSSLYLVQNGSLETMSNVSGPPSHSTPVAVGSIDIDYRPTVQVELPTTETLSITPSLAPSSGRPVTMPPPPPVQDRGPPSAPPGRQSQARRNWFQNYIHDIGAESWSPRES